MYTHFLIFNCNCFIIKIKTIENCLKFLNHSMKLVKLNFVNNRAKDVQEMILVSPMGVSKLIDMLSDSREVIRNNVSFIMTTIFIFNK